MKCKISHNGINSACLHYYQSLIHSMILSNESLSKIRKDLRDPAIQLFTRLEILKLVSKRTDELFSYGPKQLGGIFNAFDNMPYFRSFHSDGKFINYTNLTTDLVLNHLTRYQDDKSLIYNLSTDIDHLDCLRIVLINNCNPGVSLGRRGNATLIRSEYVDDTHPKIIDEIVEAGLEINNKLINLDEQLNHIIHNAKHTRTWELPQVIALQEKLDFYELQRKNLRLLFRMVKNTLRNRRTKVNPLF